MDLPALNKQKKLKYQTMKDTLPSLKSQEAVKEKYHFLQWAAITVMNTQHVISASKKSHIFWRNVESKIAWMIKNDGTENGAFGGTFKFYFNMIK